MQPVGELVTLGAQGPGHGGDGFELAGHREHLRLVPQGHDPADGDSVALHPHGRGQQDPVVDRDPPPQSPLRWSFGHERGDLIGHANQFVRIPRRGGPEQLLRVRVAQGERPVRVEAEYSVVEAVEDGALVAGHLGELFGSDAERLPPQPPPEHDRHDPAERQSKHRDGAQQNEFAADVSIEHRGEDTHRHLTDDGLAVLTRIDRDLRSHRLAQGSGFVGDVLASGQRLIRRRRDLVPDLRPVGVGEPDSAVVGDDGEADARPVAQIIGDLQHRGHDLLIGFVGVLGRGLSGGGPDVRIDRQRAGSGQCFRLGHLGDGARSHPREYAGDQGEDHDDERELRDQHTSGERTMGPGHALSVVAFERNAQKALNDLIAISAHKRARHVIWALRCFEPHIRLRRRSSCLSFSVSP